MGVEAERGYQGEKEAEELLNQIGMAVEEEEVEAEVALSHTVRVEQEAAAEEVPQSAPAGDDEPLQFLP